MLAGGVFRPAGGTRSCKQDGSLTAAHVFDDTTRGHGGRTGYHRSMGRIREFLRRVRAFHVGPFGVQWEGPEDPPATHVVPKWTYRPLSEVLAENAERGGDDRGEDDFEDIDLDIVGQLARLHPDEFLPESSLRLRLNRAGDPQVSAGLLRHHLERLQDRRLVEADDVLAPSDRPPEPGWRLSREGRQVAKECDLLT